MHKFKAIGIKHQLIFLVIITLSSLFSLITLPNLSTLAFQSITPSTNLSVTTKQTIRHWGNDLNDAAPITIIYQVPTEFSQSQKSRLLQKERMLIKNKTSLKIYKITSVNTSPHAKNLYQGKNWYKLDLWIPQKLLNQPLFQNQLRLHCKLDGMKIILDNPSYKNYQQLTQQWYQQKIACVWVLIISFILLLILLPTFTDASLVTLINLELTIDFLRVASLLKGFFFYLPLLIVSLVCLSSSAYLCNQYFKKIKIRNPIKNWNPYLNLILIILLIIPLISNTQIKLFKPDTEQTITVFLDNQQKTILTPVNLMTINELTNQIRHLNNVKQVTSVTQPGGYPVRKYQLGYQINELQEQLQQKQKSIQKISHKVVNLTNQTQIPDTLQKQADQLNEIKNRDAVNSLIEQSVTTNHDLTKQFNHHDKTIVQSQKQILNTDFQPQFNELNNIHTNLKHQFYLTAQDQLDSDFIQSCFNYNNERQTATKLNITLRDGNLHHLTSIIKHKLNGTTLSHATIGISGLPANYSNQSQQFNQLFLIYFIISLILITIINWFKFKSIKASLAILMSQIIIIAASMGNLYYLYDDYQFTFTKLFLLIGLCTIVSLITLNKSILNSIIIIPLLLVAGLRPLGIVLLTFIILFNLLLPNVLKIVKQKRTFSYKKILQL